MAQFNTDFDSDVIRIGQFITLIFPHRSCYWVYTWLLHDSGMSQDSVVAWFSRTFAVSIRIREGLIHLKLFWYFTTLARESDLHRFRSLMRCFGFSYWWTLCLQPFTSTIPVPGPCHYRSLHVTQICTNTDLVLSLVDESTTFTRTRPGTFVQGLDTVGIATPYILSCYWLCECMH